MVKRIISNIQQKLFYLLNSVFVMIILSLFINWQNIEVNASEDLTSRLGEISNLQKSYKQKTLPKVPDELAAHLGTISNLQTKATYRFGLLKYLAVQNAISKKEYWQAQNSYVVLSAYFNGCINGIIAKVEFHNEVTKNDIDCLLEKNVPTVKTSTEEKTFFQLTEDFIEPTDDRLKALKPLQFGLVSKTERKTAAQADRENSENQSLILKQAYDFFDRISDRELERERKLMEVRRQSQSRITNLLENFKWPSVDQIRPQALAVANSQPKESENIPNKCSKIVQEINNCLDEDITKCNISGGIQDKKITKWLFSLKEYCGE